MLMVMVPTCTILKNGSEATITVQCDQEIPFEFTLKEGKGILDSSLSMDCLIKVQRGKGAFLSGSFENMTYYGYPQTFLTRVPRRLVVEVVDRNNEIVKRLFSDSKHKVILDKVRDPEAPHGIRFFVRKEIL